MDTLSDGSAIALHSLATRPEMNGRRGTILAYDQSTGRATVQFEDGDKAAIKPSSIEQVYETDAADWPVFFAIERPQIDGEVILDRVLDSVPEQFLSQDDSVGFGVVLIGGQPSLTIWLRDDPVERLMVPLGSVNKWFVLGNLFEDGTQDAQRALMAFLVRKCMLLAMEGNLSLVDMDDNVLGPCTNPFLIRKIALILQNPYVLMKQWQLLLEVNLVLTGMSIADSKSLTHIAETVNRLGEALEACCRFESAAALYEEIACHLLKTEHRYTATAFSNAGLAWKRSCLYDKAESAYAKSLQHRVSREEKLPTFGNLVHLYSEMVRSKPEYDEELRLMLCVRTLIAATGNANHDAVTGNAQFGPVCYDAMRPGYESIHKDPARAWRVLDVVAEKATSPAELRAALLYYYPHEIKFGGSIPMRRRTGGENRREEKKRARSYIKENQSQQYISPCVACRKMMPEKELKECACKTVMYCNRSCQRAHWKKHKKTCPLKK